MLRLEKRSRPSLIVGIDISIYAARKAKTLTRSDVVVCSATALPFRTGTFDLVTALEVVEHVNDVSTHLAEGHRVLNQGGTYFASSPNRHGSGHMLEALGLLQANPGHLGLFTPTEFKLQLRNAGFGNLSIRPIQVGLPLPNGKFVAVSIPSPLGTTIFAIAQK